MPVETRSGDRLILGLALGLVAILVTVGSLIAVLVESQQQSCGASAVGGPPGAGASRIPSDLMPIYLAAQRAYGVPWNVLAAINYVETDFGRDLSASSAGAIGWMQFEPGTWVKYGIAVDHASRPNPYDPWDAIFAAARYLKASGAPQNLSAAIFAYNHADWYVSEVLALARSYAQGPIVLSTGNCAPLETSPGEQAEITPQGIALAPADAPVAVQQLIAAGNQIISKPYPVPEQHYGPLDQLWPAYDCSGSTSYVLYKAGLLSDGALVSGQFVSWGQAGPGRWITVYANEGHVFIEVAGIVLNTAWYAPVHPNWPPSGPRWEPASTIPAQIRDDVYGGFIERHPGGL